MRLVNVHYNHSISGISNIPFTSIRSNFHTHTLVRTKKNVENNFSSPHSRLMCVCKWIRLQIDWSILNRSHSDTKAKWPYCQVKTAEYSTTSRFFDVNIFFSSSLNSIPLQCAIYVSRFFCHSQKTTKQAESGEKKINFPSKKK